jgi:hypothetical protein
MSAGSCYVPELSWSQWCELDGVVVVVAVVPAPDEPELEPPPLAASATPAPPSAIAVTAVAAQTACFGRNTCDLLSVVVFRPSNRCTLRAAQGPPKTSVNSSRSRRRSRGGVTKTASVAPAKAATAPIANAIS